MKDESKTKEQLITELAEMRRRIAELEAAGTDRLFACLAQASKRKEGYTCVT